MGTNDNQARLLHYVNRHTGDRVSILGDRMRADALYGMATVFHDGSMVQADGYDGRPYILQVAFGLEGRDGTTFDPQHWTLA